MASQSSLGVATGASITEAWGDAVAQHLLTTETATPTTVHEGKEYVRTDEDILYRGTGAGVEAWDGYGAWKSYTPVLANSTGTGVALGNGTLTGAYRFVGGRAVAFRATLELGSTTTWWGTGNAQPSLSLPFAMSSSLTRTAGVHINCVLASTSTSYDGRVFWGSSTQVFIYIPQTGGTWPSWAVVDQTSPWTWGSGGLIAIGGVYETAS
jgi:hypothetical protein